MPELVFTEIPRAFHANVLIFESFLGLKKVPGTLSFERCTSYCAAFNGWLLFYGLIRNYLKRLRDRLASLLYYNYSEVLGVEQKGSQLNTDY